VDDVFQIVLTMQSCFARPAGTADMLHISSSGSTVKPVPSREEPALLRIVIIDALMNSEQHGAQGDLFYSLLLIAVPHWYQVTYPTMTAGDAHISCQYF
jgi:hypothetical protein